MTPERLREYYTLREANEARQREWDKGDKITLSYRGNELAGETGEACNVIKKLERERMGIRGPRATVEQLAEELADVVICADLVAMAANIDMDAAVVAKFNATSEKVGLETRLTARAIAPPDGANQIQSSDGGVEGHAEASSASLHRCHRSKKRNAPVEGSEPTAKCAALTDAGGNTGYAQAGIKPGPSEAKQGAEPVAYLCNGEGDGWKESNVVVFGKVNADHYRNERKGWTVQPLYTAPPAPDRDAVARAIYLAIYQHEGGRWECNETKDVWYEIADRFGSLLGGTRP